MTKKQKDKCGYVAIVGRPNVGKSTLLNTILGEKISITTPKPQTTRTQILGIKTVDHIQAVFIDTPGMHQTEKTAMNRYMNRLANAVITDADVIIFVIEALQWSAEDEWILEKLKHSNSRIILAINKVDKVKDKNLLLPFIDKIKSKLDFTKIVPFSALKKDNVLALEQTIFELLPESPHFYPDDQITDKNEKFLVAEIIREKVIMATEQEIPYSTTVQIEDYKVTDKLIEISAIIWVEREGQKPIIIGKGGALLKKIGTLARKDMEKLLRQKVFLRLWVKVKTNWTQHEDSFKHLGVE